MSQINIKQLKSNQQGSILFSNANNKISEDISKLNWDYNNNEFNVVGKINTETLSISGVNIDEGLDRFLVTDTNGNVFYKTDVLSSSDLNFITNPQDNRVLTSTGSQSEANAESNLTFDGSKLSVIGGISCETVLDIRGTNGQLFSITDSLEGSLFSISDISGIPIFEVFSDNTINFGTFGAEPLKISGSNVLLEQVSTDETTETGLFLDSNNNIVKKQVKELQENPFGLEGQIHKIESDNSNVIVPRDIILIGNYIKSDQELTDAQENPTTFTSFEQVFDTWKRISHGSGNSLSGNIPGQVNETQSWNYNSSTEQINTTVNSQSHIGFISDIPLSSYTLDARLFSTAPGDNDRIGVIIAFVEDENDLVTNQAFGLDPVLYPGVNTTDEFIPNQHTLTLLRNRDALDESFFISYNYGKTTQKIVANGSTLLTNTLDDWGTAFADVRVERDGDIIKGFTLNFSDLTQDVTFQDTEITVDLNSDPDLEKFKGPARYGFSSLSQSGASFTNISISGTGLNEIYDIRNGDIYEADSSGTWSINTSRDLSNEILKRSIIFNPQIKSLIFYRDIDNFDIINDLQDLSETLGNWGQIGGDIANQVDLQNLLDTKEDSFGKNTAFNKNFGNVTGTVAEGNDSRIINGQTAFTWGDHANEGYLTSYTETDPTVPTHVKNITTSDVANWNTAYNDKVNTITVTGDANKVITLTQQDGTTITANFVDNNDGNSTTDIKINALDFDDTNGILTATRDDSVEVTTTLDGRYALLGHTHTVSNITDFPTDLSFFDNGPGYITSFTNSYVDGAGFTNGILSLSRNNGLPNVTVDLDGRYVDLTTTQSIPGNKTFTQNTIFNQGIDVGYTSFSAISTYSNANDFKNFIQSPNSIFIGSNSTGTTNYPSEFGHFIMTRGSTDNRSMALWKANGNNSDFYLGNYNSTSSDWEWSEIWHSGNLRSNSQNDGRYVDLFNTQTIIGSKTFEGTTRFIDNAQIRIGSTGNGTLKFQSTGSATLADMEGDLIFRDGTSNFAPRIRIKTNGNVGIGTDPSEKLEIFGNNPILKVNQIGTAPGGSGIQLNAAGANSSSNAAFIDFDKAQIWTQTGNNNLYFGNNDRTSVFQTIDTNGNVGIGTTSPENKLHIQDSGTLALFKGNATSTNQISSIEISNGYGNEFTKRIRISAVAESGASNTTGLALFTSPSSASTVERLRIKANGNVGIGTSSPNYPLDVNGTIAIRGTANPIRIIGTGTGSGNNSFIPFYESNNSVRQAYIGFGSSGNSDFTIQNSLTSKNLVLHGNGELQYNGDISISNNNILKIGSSGQIRSNGLALVIGNSGTSNMFFRPRGESQSNRQMVLDLAGNLEVSGDVIAFSSSDRNLKENIKKIDNPVDKLKALNGVYFDWVESDDRHNYKGKDIGVIAQEVEKILPEIVTTRDNGVKAVQYDKLIPLTIEAIKEQDKKIEDLESRLEKLEKLIN